MKTIDNTQDILDSRDVINRRDELQEELDVLSEALEEAESFFEMRGEQDSPEDMDKARQALAEWQQENADELKSLNDFIDEGSNSWDDGEVLIREDHFEEYARELADDLGLLKGSDSWPLNCIDWKQAARELRYDYAGADWDGIIYYFRS